MELPDILGLPDGTPIPNKVKMNAILALANGISGLIKAALDIPSAYLERVSDAVRTKTSAEQHVALSAAKAAAQLFNTDSGLAERALNYYGSKIVKEQENREAIATKFLHRMYEFPPTEDSINDIDQDWLTAFWRLAETKSSDDVQDILGRLLCSEVCKPGSISPSTLQVLSVMTGEIGRAFERVSNLSIDDGDDVYVIHPNVYAFMHIGPMDNFGVTYDDLFELDAVRLIRSAETLLVTHEDSEVRDVKDVDYAGTTVRIDLTDKQFHLIQFTRAGKELRRLISLAPVPAYTNALMDKFNNSLFV